MIVLKTPYYKKRRGLIRRNPKIYLRTPRIKARPEIPVKKLIIFTLIVIILGLSLYEVFFSGRFLIKNIIITGNQNITQKQVEESLEPLLKAHILSNNLLFFKSSEAAAKLTSDLKRIKDIKIDKNWFPPALKIKIKERIPSLIYQTKNKKQYLIDEEGVVFAEYTEKTSEYQNLPLVEDKTQEALEINQKVLSKSFIKFIQEISNQLTPKTNLHPQIIIINETPFEIELVTKEDPRLYFDTSSDINLSINNLIRVLGEITKQGINYQGIDYIDLRIRNKIFYKYK